MKNKIEVTIFILIIVLIIILAGISSDWGLSLLKMMFD